MSVQFGPRIQDNTYNNDVPPRLKKTQENNTTVTPTNGENNVKQPEATEKAKPKIAEKSVEMIKQADKYIKSNQITIPIDQIKSVPDLSKFVKDQILQQKGDIEIPQDVLDKVGIKTPEQVSNFVKELNASGVDPEKSHVKIGYNKSESIYQATYGNNEKSGNIGANNHKITAGATFSQEKEVEDENGNKTIEKKESEFKLTYNNGTLNRLADNTPANEQKFKNAAKNVNNSIKEEDALQLRKDLLGAESNKEKKEVLEKFIDAHGKNDSWEFLNKMGLEDQSISAKVNIDGKESEIELSKEEIKAAYNTEKYGGDVGVGKGSVKLKAKIDGKEQEIEISKEDFKAAFDTKEVGGGVQLNKEQIQLRAKVGDKSAEVQIKKDQFRVSGNFGEFGGNVRAVRKREENSEVKDGKYVYTLGKEDGGGAGIKADVKKFGIKGELDLNYKTSVSVTSPAAKDAKEVPEEEKTRLQEIGKQSSIDKSVSLETAQKLKSPDSVTISYERSNKHGAGIEYNGVSADYNREAKKDDKMTVTSIPDTENNPPHNKVKVSMQIDRENTIEGSLGGSGVKLSAKNGKDNKLEIEFECDLSTEQGKEAYQKAIEGMKDGNLPIDKMSENESYEGLRSGYDNKSTKARGLSTPVANFAVNSSTQDKKDINTGNRDYSSSRTTTQNAQAILDKEKKEVKFSGTVKNDGSLSGEASLSFNIEDKKVRRREVEKYGDKTGVGGASLVDLKGEKNVSIDINVKINHENLEAISNKPIPDDASKQEKEFMQNMKNAKNDEEKVKVMQGFIASNGQRAFSFVQSLKVLPEAEMKMVGQKSEKLKPEVKAETVNKKIEDAEKSNHPKRELKDIKSNQEDIKDKADAQIEYLQQFIQDNPDMSIDDKKKMVTSIQEMLNISLAAQGNIDKINAKLQ